MARGLEGMPSPFSREKQGPEQEWNDMWHFRNVTESGEATFRGEALPTTENAASKLFKFGLQGIISWSSSASCICLVLNAS